jgi:hypothetical protein
MHVHFMSTVHICPQHSCVFSSIFGALTVIAVTGHHQTSEKLQFESFDLFWVIVRQILLYFLFLAPKSIRRSTTYMATIAPAGKTLKPTPANGYFAELTVKRESSLRQRVRSCLVVVLATYSSARIIIIRIIDIDYHHHTLNYKIGSFPPPPPCHPKCCVSFR